MTARRTRCSAIVCLSTLLLTLTGCGDSKQSAAPPANNPTDNAAAVTRSTSNRIETASGGTRTLGGTFNLDYGYRNALGNAKTGRETIDYSATANNNVVATAAPTGQVIAVACEGSQPVNVTFTTGNDVRHQFEVTAAHRT